MYFENSENGEGHSYLCVISHIFAIPSHNVKRQQVFSKKQKRKKKKRKKKKRKRRRRRKGEDDGE
jgi:rRNA processing protein Gar1